MAKFSLTGGDASGDGGNPVGDVGGASEQLGATDLFGTVFDPAVHSGADKLNADGSFRKKRGRRAGSGGTAGTSASGGGRTKASISASVDALTRVLAIVHMGLAAATKSPEMMLTEDEAKSLSQATVNVLQHFDISPDPKIEAIVGLVVTAGTIYGPKLYTINERKKEEREERKETQETYASGAVIPAFARAT